MIKDEANYFFRGGNGVTVTRHLGTPVEDRLEESVAARQLRLAFVTDLGVDLAPQVGDDHQVLKGILSTQFLEHPEIPTRYPARPKIGDPVEVENTGELSTWFHPAHM